MNLHIQSDTESTALAVLFCYAILFLTHLCEALAAVYSTALARLERHSCLTAAACTCCSEHLSCSLRCTLSCTAAALASLRLMLKALFCIEFLFASREYKFSSAFLASQCLVFVHDCLPHFKLIVLDYGRGKTDTFDESTLSLSYKPFYIAPAVRQGSNFIQSTPYFSLPASSAVHAAWRYPRILP